MDSDGSSNNGRRAAALTALQVLFTLGMLTLVGFVATQRLSTSEAWTIVGLATLAAAAALSRTSSGQRLASRLAKVSVGPVSFELLKQEVDAVAAKSPAEDVAGQPGVASHNVVDLQLKLERKLAYIAKHMLTDDGHPNYVTIGSLAYDKYLSEEQARTATQLMTLRQEDLASLSPEERREFLKAADTLVAGIRASVFRGMVQQTLEQRGWTVSNLECEATQSRPDFAATSGDVVHRVAPVFATDAESRLLERARMRLLNPSIKNSFSANTIVLPNNSAALPDPYGKPRVVRRGELQQLLKTPPRPEAEEEAVGTTA